MIGYPLDSHITYDDDGVPSYDRAITSAPYRKLINELFSDGVLPNPSSNLQVTYTNGMYVNVQPGFGIVKGCMKLEETTRTLAVSAAELDYDRIDTVVLRLDDNDDKRICDFYIVKGTPASTPVRPELTRTDSVYEIGLADLFIPKSTNSIPASRITDTRYETSRCGVISSISQFDTTTLYNQVQSDLSEFKTEEEASFVQFVAEFEAQLAEYEAGQQEDFEAWFENVQGQLSADAAGKLQAEIDAISFMYVENETLYLPNTAASVTEDTLVLYGQSNEPEGE